ncbi:hypothetical protein [Bacillus sp. GbtcB14]
MSTPRYARVNTLKTNFAKTMEYFSLRGLSVRYLNWKSISVL